MLEDMSQKNEEMSIENQIFVMETTTKCEKLKYLTNGIVELSRQEKCVRGIVTKRCRNFN